MILSGVTRVCDWITKGHSRNSMRSAETRREAVVQHSPGELWHRMWNPNVRSEKRQTGRCYGRLEFAVTLLFRRGNAVRSVEALQHRNSPDSGVLLRQKPSEKERGVPIGTAVGRLGREEPAPNGGATSSAPSVTRSPCVRFVGLVNNGSQRTGIECGC